MQTAVDHPAADRQDFTHALWTDQLATSVRNAAELGSLFAVTVRKVTPGIERFPMRINAYYLSLIRKR